LDKQIHDVVGYWTEIKLDIIKKYAAAYTKILSQKQVIRKYIYIDAFAGSGTHISRTSGQEIKGSPQVALEVDPPFSEYHFIDLDKQKIFELEKLALEREDVFVHEADCNEVLLHRIFPRARYQDFHRALCVLDPYSLQLNWNVVKAAGKMKSIDVFINFPSLDMNRNVLWSNPEGVSPRKLEEMNAFWGDDSWKRVAYKKDPQGSLFGEENILPTKKKEIVEAYGKRLIYDAGFGYVPDPLPMRNRNGAIVYYLFFASKQKVAGNIIKDIFGKYRNREQ